MSIEDDEYLMRLVEKRALLGDAGAANICGSLYAERALRELDLSLLDMAEEKFNLAARLGHAIAAEFVESTWQSVKLEYAEKIRRKRQVKLSPDKTGDL